MSELSTRIVDLPCAYERVFKNMWVGFHFSRLKELTMPERIISYALLEDLLSCASIFAGSSSRDLRNYGRQMRKPRGPVGSPCGFPTGIPPDLTHPWGSRGSVQGVHRGGPTSRMATKLGLVFPAFDRVAKGMYVPRHI